MQRHAASVTKAIGDISEVVGGLFGNVRYGLVLYRDRVEGRLVPDEDVHRMTKILAKLEPDDGGRPSEGVDRALQSATSDKMGWDQRRARSIVVVGDEGPPEKRRDAMFRALVKLRSQRPKLEVSGLIPAEAFVYHVERFFAKLVEIGGGIAIGLGKQSASSGSAFSAITPSRADSSRSVMTVAVVVVVVVIVRMTVVRLIVVRRGMLVEPWRDVADELPRAAAYERDEEDDAESDRASESPWSDVIVPDRSARRELELIEGEIGE